jgi:hypothetical protein
MLMHPFLDVPYNPSLGHFLGGFDIYDREESLGIELSEYDPSCPLDREFLISKFIIKRFAGVRLLTVTRVCSLKFLSMIR